MVEFDLHRIYSKNGDGATIGILLSKTRKAKFWMTIERPLFFNGKSNVKRECCIPKDNYFAELFRSNKFQKGYYELQKVKDRDKIFPVSYFTRFTVSYALIPEKWQKESFMIREKNWTIGCYNFLSQPW